MKTCEGFVASAPANAIIEPSGDSATAVKAGTRDVSAPTSVLTRTSDGAAARRQGDHRTRTAANPSAKTAAANQGIIERFCGVASATAALMCRPDADSKSAAALSLSRYRTTERSGIRARR